MKLVFFGGIQGVGKSTLISWLEKEYVGRIMMLNPGELFRRYFYNERIKTVEEIEEMLVGELENAPVDATVVAHWHYAVRRPSGFIPQISFSRLKRLAESGKVERAIFMVVGASAETVQKRRLKDCHNKKREESLAAIHEEMDADEGFLTKELAIFTQALGEQNVEVIRLANEDPDAAKAALHEIFKALLG